MICIFSSSVDHSTTEVIRWLYYLGRNEIIRINYDDPNLNNSVRFEIVAGTFVFQINGQFIHLSDIESVWYRKGKNWICDQFYPVTVKDHSIFTAYFANKLKMEELTIAAYLHHIIENTVPVLGSSTKGRLNKLLVLCAAKEMGFLVPDFYVSNNREGIERIFHQMPDLITKSASDGLYLFEREEKGMGYFSYTEQVDKEITASLPEQLSPSFLQRNIHKKFECRVFFLEGTCYSMAIFSQSDEQTKTDFRKYIETKPNRNVPFKLPDQIEQKITQLFKKIDLNTGSVDLIVDHNDNFYFLEINPVGQFGMVSKPCNYFLEKQVALNLIQNAKKNRGN